MLKLSFTQMGSAVCLALTLWGCPDPAPPQSCSPDSCPRFTSCDDETLTCTLLDTVDPQHVGGVPAMILGPNGEVQVAAYDQHSQDLVFGVWDAAEGRLRFQIVDDQGDVGSALAMTRFSDGSPAIAYYDASKARLKFAFVGEDDAWHLEVIDETSSVGTDIGIAVRQDDVVHVSYRDITYQALRYARRDAGIWDIAFVDTGRDDPSRIPAEEACPPAQREAVGAGVGLSSRIAVQGSTPVIVYHDADCGTLRMARGDAGGWTLRVLDGWDAAAYQGPRRPPARVVGRFADVAVDPLGHVAIVYFDADDGVLKALRSPSGTPVIEVVDNGVRIDALGNTDKHVVGQLPALAFDASGNAVVTHFDASTRGALLSTRENDAWRTQRLPDQQEGFGTDIVIDQDGVRHIVGRNRTNPNLANLGTVRIAP